MKISISNRDLIIILNYQSNFKIVALNEIFFWNAFFVLNLRAILCEKNLLKCMIANHWNKVLTIT
jgi:hypothetical protein